MQYSDDPFIIVKSSPKAQTYTSVTNFEQTPNNKNCQTLREHESYIRFFREYTELSDNKQLRKAQKIFVKMTKYIPTRSAVQIKSHHQKILNRYGTVQKALNSLEQEIRRWKRLRYRATTTFQERATQITHETTLEEKRSKEQTLSNNEDLELFNILDWSSGLHSDLNYLN